MDPTQQAAHDQALQRLMAMAELSRKKRERDAIRAEQMGQPMPMPQQQTMMGNIGGIMQNNPYMGKLGLLGGAYGAMAGAGADFLKKKLHIDLLNKNAYGRFAKKHFSKRGLYHDAGRIAKKLGGLF